METKKTRFDYKAALNELILPAIPQVNVLALNIYHKLRDCPAYEKLAQGADLDVPMPNGLPFSDIPTKDLAYAARVIYYLGHWGGSGKDNRGAYWKFSNLADQILRKRLGLETRGHRHGDGWHFEVLEGMLRLCASSPNQWLWIELGPATENFLEHARSWMCSLPVYSSVGQRRNDWEDKACEAAREVPALLYGQLDPQWQALIGIAERYMREEGKGSDDCTECGRQKLFGSDASNHEFKCSHYPMTARADALLQHANVFGITKEQQQAIRDLLCGPMKAKD